MCSFLAPKEAPASGYAFGKGIYFADKFEKSLNYCRGGRLMFVCEVLTGDIYETHSAEYMEQPPKGYHCKKKKKAEI